MLEGLLKIRLLDLDFTESGLECDAADPFGFTRLGVLQLFLKLGDFFADPGGGLLHLRLSLSDVVWIEQHQVPSDRRADPLTEVRVGAANAFDHDPGRSEGADPKGAIIRR
ncbi:hypothetical protein [Ensifer adhaerens]|uniref:hypothetical protein n=1 Tax=Ensifer adhaerens TaxID=106592 RepID=UPI001F47B8FE|nr:hypothetical protein [Ensifer adhaerens]